VKSKLITFGYGWLFFVIFFCWVAMGYLLGELVFLLEMDSLLMKIIFRRLGYLF